MTAQARLADYNQRAFCLDWLYINALMPAGASMSMASPMMLVGAPGSTAACRGGGARFINNGAASQNITDNADSASDYFFNSFAGVRIEF